jgi:hypothetical protein
MLLLANRMVAKARKSGDAWREVYFLTSDELWDAKADKERQKGMKLPQKVKNKVSEKITDFVSRPYLAWHAGIHFKDVKVYRKYVSRDSDPNTVNNQNADPACGEKDRALQRAMHFGNYSGRYDGAHDHDPFKTTGFFGLYVTNFLSLQPLLHIFILGITVSTGGRVMLHTVKFFASLMVVGLFFQSDSKSLSYESDSECGDMNRFQRSIEQKIAVGVFSVLFTLPPVKILEIGFKHKFTFKETWSDEVLQKALRLRHIKDNIVWCAGSLYMFVCCFFMVVFFANISKKDHWDFLEAVFFKIFNMFLVSPAIVAGLLTVAVWLWKRCAMKKTLVSFNVHSFMLHAVAGDAVDTEKGDNNSDKHSAKAKEHWRRNSAPLPSTPDKLQQKEATKRPQRSHTSERPQRNHTSQALPRKSAVTGHGLCSADVLQHREEKQLDEEAAVARSCTADEVEAAAERSCPIDEADKVDEAHKSSELSIKSSGSNVSGAMGELRTLSTPHSDLHASCPPPLTKEASVKTGGSNQKKSDSVNSVHEANTEGCRGSDHKRRTRSKPGSKTSHIDKNPWRSTKRTIEMPMSFVNVAASADGGLERAGTCPRKKKQKPHEQDLEQSNTEGGVGCRGVPASHSAPHRRTTKKHTTSPAHKHHHALPTNAKKSCKEAHH